jgi:hypothetical protein
MRAQRVGARLLRWATRHCNARLVDDVVLPVVADMQFEAVTHDHRSPIVRGWIRFRGCVAFLRALGLAVLVHHGSTSMTPKVLDWLRLLVAIPAALLVTAAVNYSTGLGVHWLLFDIGGLCPGCEDGYRSWLVTPILTSLMTAAFVWTMCLVAPRRRRPPVAIASVILVGIWGGILVVGTLAYWPNHNVGGPLAMGLTGWLGGAVAYWLARRGRPARQAA